MTRIGSCVCPYCAAIVEVFIPKYQQEDHFHMFEAIAECYNGHTLSEDEMHNTFVLAGE